MTLQELRDKRNTIVAQMRGILDKAKAEKRDLTAEEQVNYDKAFKDQDTLRSQIAAEERQLEIEREVATAAANNQRSAAAGNQGGQQQREQRGQGPGDHTSTPEYRAAFEHLIMYGPQGLSGDEVRALQANGNALGGFLVLPQEMSTTLVKTVDDLVFIRNKATKFRLPKAQSLGFPSLDADPDDGDWTVELGTGNEDSAMAFGKRELMPHPFAKRIKVSNKLLETAGLDVESIVMQRLGYKFGITEEKAFLLGNGNNQPLGLFVADNNGLGTGRDVSSGNTTTAITFDGLLSAKYSLKAQYMRTAEWLFHRDGVKQIAMIKDTTNQYIWQPAKTASEPDLLLGRPVNMSEYVPNTFTTGLYVGMFADFSWYWIADAMDMRMQRLAELYAETNQVGFIARKETDGMPVLSEAFARVKLA